MSLTFLFSSDFDVFLKLSVEFKRVFVVLLLGG